MVSAGHGQLIGTSALQVAFSQFRLYAPAMNLLSSLRLAVCCLAIMGMVGSSFARSAMVMAPEMQVMHSDVAMHSNAMADQAAMEMAGEMPCCPKGMPERDSMKDCPFMTLCLAKIVFAPGPAASATEPRLGEGVVRPFTGAYVRDCSRPPPSRPPIA